LIYAGQVLYVPYVPTRTPTIIRVTLIPDTLPPPSITPTPTDTPTGFQRGSASVANCAISFSVVVSDPDGINYVKVIYSVNGSGSFMAVMTQSQGVYQVSASPQQNTTPSDTIAYYFHAVDLVGHITESNRATIQADYCVDARGSNNFRTRQMRLLPDLTFLGLGEYQRLSLLQRHNYRITPLTTTTPSPHSADVKRTGSKSARRNWT
jgi:hypothetical protein